MNPAGLRLVRRIQQALESFYRLDPAPCITGFVVDGEPSRREQLLILEEEDLYLRLSLDPALPQALASGRLEPGNLDQFCLLVEGVSHFLCVIFCARQQRPVSVLELELQAEVDKYVACALLAVRAPELPRGELHALLFENFRLAPGLLAIEQHRYRTANHLARRYTLSLERHLARRLGWTAVLAELRRFYRLAYRDKRQLIERR